jgi:outer membrane protein, heavy metal efflux system
MNAYLVLAMILSAIQQPAAAGQSVPEPNADSPTPLETLIQEASGRNPQVLAARAQAHSASERPSQMATLPDPEVMLQHMSVGSPRPFASYDTSNFSYIGLGVSQSLPFPGKLRLRGEMAHHEAAAAEENLEATRREVVETLKTKYFRLAYLEKALATLERDGKLLDQIARIAGARYRVGKGNQQEVLRAQLEQTRLLRDVEMNRQEIAGLEASLKQLLDRPPDSPDIVAEKLTETSFPYGSNELLARVKDETPEVLAARDLIEQARSGVALARKAFYPDFNLQYMWQRTGDHFPDYYMITLGARVPIFAHRRQEPELRQAEADLDRSRRQYESNVQTVYFEVRDEFVTAEADARILKIYREGLIPQATNTFDAGLSSYEAGSQDFQTLISSFLDVLNLDLEYWRTLAEHETALARIERRTGVPLGRRSATPAAASPKGSKP